MKWLAGLLLCVAFACLGQTDGGGRDVSVALFSAEPVRHVTVVAAGPQAWWAACATCRHQPIATALRLPEVREVWAGGPITIRDEEHAQVRTANGRWHLRVTDEGYVDVFVALPSERYVAGVLMGETAPGEPVESLRAMAVVARTFILRSPAKNVQNRLASDTCDSTACQAVKLGAVSDAVNAAVRSTVGETLWFHGERAHVFFSGNCGGTTESAEAVWPELANVPYLRSIQDPYCVRADRAAWHAEVPLTALQQIAKEEGWRLPSHISSARVVDRTASQRCRTLEFGDDRGETSKVSASTLRLAIGRSLGWNLIRSDAYRVHIRDGALVFDGHGHGHGVGLCQEGATEMARQRKSYREILAFYFPGTEVRVTLGDEGWQQSSQSGIHFMSTITLPQASIEAAVNAWKTAKSKLSLQQEVEPEVIFAPSTEVFRQMTSQPGWQLASTSGNTIVLQPASIFAANHLSPEKTLQHEMLHVAIESGSSAKTPLWLREGLVEMLSGEATPGKPSLSAEETDRLLQSSNSRLESETAHKAAAARAKLLVERYGISSVRAWVIEGSPIPAG